MSNHWNVTKMTPFLDDLASKGIGDTEFIKTFMNNRTPLLKNAVGPHVPYNVITTLGSDIVSKSNPATIQGEAPISMVEMLVNGDSVINTMAWSSTTAWQVKIPNPADQTIALSFAAFDSVGAIVGLRTVNLISAVNWVAPTVLTVIPSSGPLSGGTNVTITGTGFRPGVKVKFLGTFARTVTYTSSTELHVTTPARRTKGTMAVTSINLDGRSGSLVAGFTYGP
jgi:hypothetical protein